MCPNYTRKVPKEAEHGPSNCKMLFNCPDQRPACGSEQNPDAHPHHQAWELGFQECHSFKKALHLSEERMLTVMSGGALPVRKETKTEPLGGPLSPGILNFVSACNEKNSTRICSRQGCHPWFWQTWTQLFHSPLLSVFSLSPWGKAGMRPVRGLHTLSLPTLCCFENFKWVIKEQWYKLDYVMSYTNVELPSLIRGINSLGATCTAPVSSEGLIKGFLGTETAPKGTLWR